jgi:hypothetical protein
MSRKNPERERLLIMTPIPHGQRRLYGRSAPVGRRASRLERYRSGEAGQSRADRGISAGQIG